MLHHPTEGAGLHAYLRLPSSLASHPGRASADSSARLAGGGSCHAHTINPRPASAAGGSDLRDHAVRLRNVAGVRAWADVAIDKAKPATANNLIMILLLC